MSKKSIIAVLGAVVLMVVASLTLVFTIGPKTSAADETVYTVPVGYLNLTNDGKTLGDNSWSSNAFNADGKTWIKSHAKYRVEIPEGVTSIGYHAFMDCSGLTSITIPEGVTSIGDLAFYDCSSLTSINIPEGVTSIGSSAFSGCDGLTSMTVDPNNTQYTSQDNEGHECNCIIIKSSNVLFFGCQNTIIPEGVTSIGDHAFYGCSGLTSITISEGVTSIGQYAFSHCSSLTSITIPEGVTSIGGYAFSSCSGLTSITIPASLTSIGYQAFYNCRGLTSINYLGTIEQWVQINIADYYAHPAYYTNKLVINGTEVTTVELSNTVTSIGDYAFYNCRGLTSITIPEGVTRIGDFVFSNCSGLTSIMIPDSVTSIGYCAFNGCSGLTSITIPEGVTSIGVGAFGRCSGLTSITIPEGVTSIGEEAFYGCSGLTSITIPAGVTSSIGRAAFYGCSGLTSITIPEGVTSIGRCAFSGCSGLTSITIPESVTSIDDEAFSGCRGLTSITIPASLTSIGYKAFYSCSGLNEIIVRNPDLIGNTNLTYGNSAKVYLGADQNTVSFVTNCDTTIDSRLIDFGGVTPEPTITLTKEHYTFAGWYSDEQYTKPFTFETPIKHDITLYAKWDADKFTVTFNSNGGSDVNSRQVDYGTTTTSPRPSKTGYKLLGWKLNGETFDFANTPITEDITLVAEWERLCVVTFDSNGGYEINPQYVEKNGYAYFRWTEKPYHGLVGWKLNGAEFDFNNTAITEDITLVADWEIYTYEVIFDSNGGTAVPSQVVEHGTKVIIPTDPTRDGYFFCGWYRISFSYSGSGYSGNKTTVTEYDFETPVTEYMTLTAVWKKIYNVTFANANGEVYTTRAVVEGDLVQAPDITVDGYLVSWYAGDKAYDFTTPVTADMTLTAQLDENSVKVNNQNNNAVIWGIAGTAAGILIIGGIVVGIIISKRRRK